MGGDGPAAPTASDYRALIMPLTVFMVIMLVVVAREVSIARTL